MTPARKVVGAIIAAALLGAAAMIPIIGSPSQSPVVGRLAFVPRTAEQQPSAGVRQAGLVYVKVPSLESVKLTITHPGLDSDIDGLGWSADTMRVLSVAKIRRQAGPDALQPSAWVPCVVDLRTKELLPVTAPTMDRKFFDAHWLPEGQRIIAWVITGKDPNLAWGDSGVWVKKGDSRLTVIDVKSKREKTIWRTSDPFRYACSPARDEVLIWSGDYYLVSVDHGVRWKMKGSDTPNSFSFSPDGRKIAIHANGKLQTIDRNTRARRVVYTGEGPARSLEWSPDGKWVAFREARNKAVSFDPPMVDFGWAVIAVNVETKKVHEFPDKAYKQGEFSYTPDVLGWTKDSKNLVLNVPEYTGKPRPQDMRDRLVLCPLAGGKGVAVADITSRIGALAWLPR